MENSDQRIQRIAKKIPAIQLFQDLEFINAEIETIKEDLNSLLILPDEFSNNYLSNNEILKYERIIEKRD